MGRQPLGYEFGDRVGIHAPPRYRQQVRHQDRRTRTGFVAQGDGVLDIRMRAQRRIDLTQFDPETADLYLEVRATHIVQFPVHRRQRLVTGPLPGCRVPAHHITGAIHPRTLEAVRVGDESVGAQVRPVVVTARQRATGQVQLTRHAGRYRLQSRVEDQCRHTVHRIADGDVLPGEQPRVRRDDGRLGGAVTVEVLAARLPFRQQFRGGHITTDGQHFQRVQPRRVDSAQHSGRDDRMGDGFGPQEIGQVRTTDDLTRHHHQGRARESGAHPFQYRRIEAR